ncbi:MAG: methionyl-tRNA formyltransferase [Candidatus Omnitrophota bacterium]
MRIVFFGTSEFAVKPLEAILNSRHEVSAVITQPVRQKGRGLKVLPQPVEECADKQNVKILKFPDVNSKDAIESLKKEAAHIFVVAAFGQILKKDLLGVPALYSINIHASLLPRYRGAAPIQRAIINGDKKTGISIIRMNEGLDGGDILSQKEIAIDENDNSLTLSNKLSILGAEMISDALDIIESEDVKFSPQSGAEASYASKLKKEDGLIGWEKDALSIRDLIRGCFPWPSAYTYIEGKMLKILDADLLPGDDIHKPGEITDVNDKGISVACGNGSLLVKKLQLEGKKPLHAAEFLRGKPLKKDMIFRR